MSPVTCFVYPHGRYNDRKGKVPFGKASSVFWVFALGRCVVKLRVGFTIRG